MDDTGTIYCQVAACSKQFDDRVLWSHHVKTEHPTLPAIILPLTEHKYLQKNSSGKFRCKAPNCNDKFKKVVSWVWHFTGTHLELIEDGRPVASVSTPLAKRNVDKDLKRISPSSGSLHTSSSIGRWLDELPEYTKRGES